MKTFLAAAAVLFVVTASPAAAAQTAPDSFNDLSSPGQSVIGSLGGQPEMLWNNRGVLVLDEVTPAPEPGEWAMILAGLSVVGFAARRRRKA